MLFTFSDADASLQAYLGDQNTNRSLAYSKRAVSDALRELSNAHEWTYYKATGRITTSASYNTGTVVFDYTGGTYERQLTLTGGTWPEWIADGVVVINTIPYEVSERKSDTVIVLSKSSNPGEDVASTSFTCYRDTYPLPIDFQALDRALNLQRIFEMQYVTPRDWLTTQRWLRTPNMVWYYTIIGDQNYQGAMAMKFAGAPSSVETIDFVYKRRPRPMRYHEEKTGTVSVSSGSSTVTGAGTAFSQFMVGSVIRLYNTSNYPTNEEGDYPAFVERTIMSVSSTTSLTVDATVPDAYTSVKYVITDPIDIDKQTMLGAYKRTCEKLIEHQRQGNNYKSVVEAWKMELLEAMAADKRYIGTSYAGEGLRGGAGRIIDDAIVRFS